MTSKNTREKIIEEATKLFAKYGYENTSMAVISKKVGIEKASLYYFFKDKRELIAAALEGFWGKMAECIDAELDRKNFLHYLTLIIKMYLRAGFMVLSTDIVFGNRGFETAMERVMYLRKLLRDFLKKEGVKDPEYAESLVAHAIQGYVIQTQLKATNIPPEKYANYIYNLILKEK